MLTPNSTPDKIRTQTKDEPKYDYYYYRSTIIPFTFIFGYCYDAVRSPLVGLVQIKTSNLAIPNHPLTQEWQIQLDNDQINSSVQNMMDASGRRITKLDWNLYYKSFTLLRQSYPLKDLIHEHFLNQLMRLGIKSGSNQTSESWHGSTWPSHEDSQFTYRKSCIILHAFILGTELLIVKKKCKKKKKPQQFNFEVRKDCCNTDKSTGPEPAGDPAGWRGGTAEKPLERPFLGHFSVICQVSNNTFILLNKNSI